MNLKRTKLGAARLYAGLALASFAILPAACAKGPPKEVDVSQQVAKDAENDRLQYMETITARPAYREFGLTGNGVRVTIMGEIVDPTHPDLTKRIIRQYDAVSDGKSILAGSGSLPNGFEKLGPGDGHGTHIAGTIAAECDKVAFRGVACGATIDVYNLGAYDNPDRFPVTNWQGEDQYARLMIGFARSLRDIAARGESRITTGSFNLETPAYKLKPSGPLYGLPLTELLPKAMKIKSPEAAAKKGLAQFEQPADIVQFKRLLKKAEGRQEVLASLFIQQSREWHDLGDAIAAYQAKDGVYLVTESNNVFEDQSSLLNAMPDFHPKVDRDLWLSVVMVAREGEDPKTPYQTPINSCGKQARDYCIVTPSADVPSTMTKRVAESALPLIKVDGRYHQIFSGHSMGAPMVAATLALMEELNREKKLGLSMKDLVRIMKQNANRSFPGYDPARHGVGMLDVKAALRAMTAKKS